MMGTLVGNGLKEELSKHSRVEMYLGPYQISIVKFFYEHS